jgi:hypothetical protein
MKFVCGLFFCLAFSLGVMAQQQHFVYIQTESGEPFYVQMGDTIYSSSASGYLILAPLIDSSYKIAIGFPKNEWSQQQYSFTIDNNDPGFLLKFSANKWVLSNLQKAGNIIISEPVNGYDTVGTEMRTDAFAIMLSNVVNDPSIKQNITEETKENTVMDSLMAKKTEALPLWSMVTKISSKKTSEGTAITYVDVYGDQRDTIKIMLPVIKKVKLAKPKAVPDEEVSAPIAEEVQQPIAKTTKPDKPKEEKFLNISVAPKNTVDSTTKVIKEVTVVKNKKIDTTLLINSNNTTVNTTVVASPIKKDTVSIAPKPVMVNSECKNLATQEDFIKLRRKMADQTDDNSMLVVAKKTFRTRCFTTEQIKNMGALFFSDQGRYTFFETAYEVVSDGQNYEVLKNQLTDPAYIARFESMIHH